MGMRIRVYPQPNSTGARRNRARKCHRQRLRRLRREQRLAARQLAAGALYAYWPWSGGSPGTGGWGPLPWLAGSLPYSGPFSHAPYGYSPQAQSPYQLGSWAPGPGVGAVGGATWLGFAPPTPRLSLWDLLNC